MDLQKLGVFGFIDSMSGPEIKAFARKVERLGYSTLWFPEAFGRDPFALAAHILTVTERLTVGTGIANVWKREAVTTIGAARTLAELFPDRFILGLGISHKPMVTQLGITYAKPVSFMREYLAKIRSAPYTAPRPKSDPPLVVAALLPKMLELAAAETDGTFPVYITPERTARMRLAMGPNKWICVQQVAMLETDADKARRAARALVGFYLGLPNYLQSLSSIGFDESDFAEGGSDRLIDAMIAWGDEKTLRERIAAHYRAGATHVCVTLLPSQTPARDRSLRLDDHALEVLAPL
jgi:probable F420-dependent oxidoreductase